MIPILIINCTLIIKSYSNKDEVPSIGRIFPMIILTDSMTPEFESGDLIVCKTADVEDIKVGDIICFYDPAGNDKVIAPGTDGSYTFDLKNTSSQSADYKIWVETTVSSNTTDMPLQTRMSSTEGWLLGSNYFDELRVTKADIAYTGDVSVQDSEGNKIPTEHVKLMI